MTQTKVLNTQTVVETEKTQRAKEILFSPVTVENETVASSGMEKFSNAYESEKLQKILDKHDLNNYTNTQDNSIATETQQVNKSFQDLLDTQTVSPVQTEQKVLSKPKMKTEPSKREIEFSWQTCANSILCCNRFIWISCYF